MLVSGLRFRLRPCFVFLLRPVRSAFAGLGAVSVLVALLVLGLSLGVAPGAHAQQGNTESSETPVSEETTSQESTEGTLTQEVISDFRAGNYQAVLSATQSTVERDDIDARVYLVRGLAFAQTGRDVAADSMLSLAVDGGLASADVIQARYRVRFRLGRYEAALEDVHRLLDETPTNPDLRQRRARLLNKLGRHDEAIEELRRLASVHAEDPSGLVALSDTYDRIEKSDSAYAIARRAVETFPRRHLPQLHLADLHLRRDSLQQAESALKTALESAGMQPFLRSVARANLGYVYARTGRPDSALAMTTEGVEAWPDNPYAHRNRALAHLELGHTAKACRDLRTALENDYHTAFGAHTKFGPDPEPLLDEHCPADQNPESQKPESQKPE